MSKIFWLASYPKSGNTWFRAFLTNLRRDTDTPASINVLDGANSSSRRLFDETTGAESSDLTPSEVERLFPSVFEHIAARAEEPLFFKIHHAYTFGANGRPLIPGSATRGAVYLLRNPLDVAVSYAHHRGEDIETIIDGMRDEEEALAHSPDRLYPVLRQSLLSWNSHVLSWMEHTAFPVHLMRYEDMSHAPLRTFSGAARFLGLSDDPQRIQKALRFSSFGELQKQEQAAGFAGKSSGSPSFFRTGAVGSWRQVLTEPQARRLVHDHRGVMQQFGYLTPDGDPVY